MDSNFTLLDKRYRLYRVYIPMLGFSDLPSRGMKFHYYNIDGYSPIVLESYYQFIHSMADIPKPEFTRHTLSPLIFLRNKEFSSKILGVKYAIVKSGNQAILAKARWFMPQAVLVKDAIILPDLDKQLQYIKKADFNPLKQVLLEKAPDYNEAFTSNEIHSNALVKENFVKIIQYHPNWIELKASSDKNTYLLLSELFYPGWKAYVDGKNVPILRADYLLRAIPLATGEHNIIFVYRPMSLVIGALITFLTLLILLGYMYLIRYRKKRLW